MLGSLAAFILLIIGEGINILAEMLSAKLPSAHALLEYRNLFLFGMVIVGCSFLLFGYAIGYHASKSIWTVTVSSVVAILLVEPFLAYFFFHQSSRAVQNRLGRVIPRRHRLASRWAISSSTPSLGAVSPFS